MAARGSVFQRCPRPAPGTPGCPERCRVHRWAYRVELPRVGGQRQQATKSGFTTRSDAQKALTALLASAHSGAPLPSRQTVGEYLEEWYARQRDSGRIRQTTLRSYRGHLDLHLLPGIGSIRLGDLRPHHIERTYAGLRQPRRGKRPLSPATIRRVHATLRSALNSAVKRGELAHSPATHVDLPSAPRPKTSVWSAGQFSRFLEATKNERLYALFVLAGLRGLRRGELLGLRWADVDLGNGELTVAQQLVQVGHQTMFSPPKTERGRRVVALDPMTSDALRAWRAVQAAERLAWGAGYTDSGLVFTRENGRPLHPETVTKQFRRLVQRHGLPVIRLHDLRHTSATLGILSGEDMRLVSRRLGHASIAITVDTYTHATETAAHDAAERMAVLIRNSGLGRAAVPE